MRIVGKGLRVRIVGNELRGEDSRKWVLIVRVVGKGLK